MNSKLRLFLDLAPLGVFFVAYRYWGLLAATACIIVTTLISLAITYYYEKRLAPMPLISGVLIAIMGGFTLYLNDETFVKMKPTLVNLIFAGMLLGGLLFKKSMFKLLLDGALTLSEEGWRSLTVRWGLFFVFLAALNEVIWRSFSTDFWVNFKVFGMLTLTILFTAAQVPLIKRTMIEDSENANAADKS
jgi:intracellular septation protein